MNSGGFLNGLDAGLPDLDAVDTLDFNRLHAALMRPADKAPQKLAAALYLIDEVANEDGERAIRKELRQKLPSFRVAETKNEAELAIAVWLENPEIIEDAHARLNAFEPRKFASWRSLEEILPDPPKDLGAVVSAIAGQLERVFLSADEDRHGAGQPPRRFRLFQYPQGDSVVRFLVRHAGRLQNTPSVRDNGDTYLALFRPEIYDVVIFDHEARELRINAGSKREQRAYARVFGHHLCGNEETFEEAGKYTLEPLRDGPESLACSMVRGIKKIQLTELHMHHGGEQNEYEIRRANDLFETSFYRDGGFPAGVPFTKASFKVTFAHNDNVRKVTITPPMHATYTRDDDGDLIEVWLRAQGFTVTDSQADVANTPRQA